MSELENYTKEYTNTAENNNSIHRAFTDKVNDSELLSNHRGFVEQNKYGFGDRAFHYMWFLILNHLNENNRNPIDALEIGVFKGQVISLWSLISKTNNLPVQINAVSPFEGNVDIKVSKFKSLLYKIIPFYRQEIKDGNLYQKEDFMNLNQKIFDQFDVDFSKVKKFIGYSTDEEILDSLSSEKFDLIYVDGDHSFQGVTKDIKNFAPKIKTGGILVMDDASCNIPGGENGEYWKGHKSVSDACEIIPDFGFENILNVGHNRVYCKKGE